MNLWTRFVAHYCAAPAAGFSMDISRMNFDSGFLGVMEGSMKRAYDAMAALESGAIANPDEQRMVGHYWLRAPQLAPSSAIRDEIAAVVELIKKFASEIHSGQTKPPTAARFTRVLSVGIGGSALGPMFVADALGGPSVDRMTVDFIDNTDPDGIARILARIGQGLAETLVIVTSKSGGTPETHNAMTLVSQAYAKAGLQFAAHAVAITMEGSRMDRLAAEGHWLKRFPMFDWVGGRTSELSAVGLLPAALQGLDIQGMLDGAAACDEITRSRDTRSNPAALLALMWYHATGGKGLKDMVVLPYKDRLLLFSRYLQQLVMESLGKQLDLDGNRVEQGISVYGNKGSTDQHAYVQQLRDGVGNFFATFIRVLEEGGESTEVQPGATAGDFLHGFLLGTREALHANGRESITITIHRVDARTIGAMIALFERAVGYYATLININAYHQPGVEAGKKAAADVLALQSRVISALTPAPQTAEGLSAAIGEGSVETAFLILEHLAANGRARIVEESAPGKTAFAKV